VFFCPVDVPVFGVSQSDFVLGLVLVAGILGVGHSLDVLFIEKVFMRVFVG